LGQPTDLILKEVTRSLLRVTVSKDDSEHNFASTPGRATR
jgi:hypothetical protein